jgi:hypothetical protein
MTSSVVGGAMFCLLMFVVPTSSGAPLLSASRPRLQLPAVEIVEIADSDDSGSISKTESEDRGRNEPGDEIYNVETLPGVPLSPPPGSAEVSDRQTFTPSACESWTAPQT